MDFVISNPNISLSHYKYKDNNEQNIQCHYYVQTYMKRIKTIFSLLSLNFVFIIRYIKTIPMPAFICLFFPLI